MDTEEGEMGKFLIFAVAAVILLAFIGSREDGAEKTNTVTACKDGGRIVSKANVASGIPCDAASGVALIINTSGYKCSSMDYIRTFISGSGYKVGCDNKYDYEVEDRGGRWVVTVR